jgi:deoxyribodipyrimidine photo-lyase
MLVSVASYHLWLPWRPTALHLGKHFLDFEPGIHFPQVQMQSGTTGTNTLRIYSPLRQAKVQDPTGAFIRRWIPELAAVPDDFIHAPHEMPPLLQQSCGVVVGRHYPAPIVDEKEALGHAREQLTAARRRLRTDDAARAETAALLERHGSRRPPRQRAALGRSPGSRAMSAVTSAAVTSAAVTSAAVTSAAVTSAAVTSGARGQQSLFSFRAVMLEDDARDTDDVHDDVDDDMP